jgi:hypothetical protein
MIKINTILTNFFLTRSKIESSNGFGKNTIDGSINKRKINGTSSSGKEDVIKFLHNTTNNVQVNVYMYAAWVDHFICNKMGNIGHE